MLSVTDNFCYRQLLTKVPKVAGACVQKISLVVDTNQRMLLVSNEIRVLKNTVEECTGIISLKSYVAE